MKLTEHIKIFSELLNQWDSKIRIKTIYPLPISGSKRQYFRIETNRQSVIGCYNDDIIENEAFFHFTDKFLGAGLFVPKLYHIHTNKQYYLLQDLGNETLFLKLTKSQNFNTEILPLYKMAITALIQFQIEGGKIIDFSKAYPRDTFDQQSILWDLSYFKYYWLKFSDISFNEQLLENDFRTFADYLLSLPHNFFLYRDFQSRNIMIQNGKLFFVDYQGGRRGALYYDLASLLYDSKADLPISIRNSLLDFYILEIKKYLPEIDDNKFKNEFYAYALVRILQAFGAYGFRGIYEYKVHFLKSIPFAIKNLTEILEKGNFSFTAPHLFNVLETIIKGKQWEKFAIQEIKEEKLHICITSFSYRKPLPFDISGNGGGFVFDCRILPNPGRIDNYKALTGTDWPVIKYLEIQPVVKKYLSNVISLVEAGVDNYLERNFSNLMVNFGCTGGQHRSVFCAEQLFSHLQQKYGNRIKITLTHRELE